MAKKKKVTPKRKASPADRVLNIIIAVVVLVFVGLAAWAISPKISEKIEAYKAEQQAALPDTIEKRANEKGITVEQFIADYGITGENITGETMMSDVVESMTVENYAKLEGTTVEEYITANGLPETVTGAMTVGEANDLVPIKTVIASSGMDFETFKTTYELGDDVTEDTPWSQVEETVMQKAQEMMATAETETAEGETAETAETAEGEAEATEETADAEATEEAAE